MPLQQSKPVPRTSAQPVQSTESNEFKNSLESLLARGNPLMTGVARKQTVVKPAKQEEEQREKIKFDIFADEEPGLNKYKSTAPMLDNVSVINKFNVCLGCQHDEAIVAQEQSNQQAVRL